MPKLQGQITELFRQLLSEGVLLEVEVAPEWLKRPGRDEFGDGWSLVSAVYGDLTGLILPDVAPPREHRRLDVVITYPDALRRVFEFDEGQHFTGARVRTLEYYAGISTAFDINDWRNRALALAGRERGGGWGASKPPLFPGSGGRHRQRAFRDFLADYLPTQRDGWLPTARIHDTEAKAALRDPSPVASLASLWDERTGESVGSVSCREA
jgi:hypothetical protein